MMAPSAIMGPLGVAAIITTSRRTVTKLVSAQTASHALSTWHALWPTSNWSGRTRRILILILMRRPLSVFRNLAKLVTSLSLRSTCVWVSRNREHRSHPPHSQLPAHVRSRPKKERGVFRCTMLRWSVLAPFERTRLHRLDGRYPLTPEQSMGNKVSPTRVRYDERTLVFEKIMRSCVLYERHALG